MPVNPAARQGENKTFNEKQYRDRASEYAERSKNAEGATEAREFSDLEKSFTTLADNEQWLSENHQRTVQSSAHAAPGVSRLAKEEEHLLRCLGAAIIMQWNGLPSDIRRLLFDTATTMGDPLDVASLRERVARFLHKHDGAVEPAASGAAVPINANEAAR
jgi:hypothetical protein